ncbi:MAG: ATP-binding protein [Catenulispora sp.]|nr:ATP-binding protein [Catenulispora sp.]
MTHRPRTAQSRPAAGAPAASAAALRARADPVRLVIPADPDFVVLVRSTAAHLGVRIGLSVAEIEDFRLAVDEACGLFLSREACGVVQGLRRPGTGEMLVCEFCDSGDAVAVVVSAVVGGDFAGEQVGTFGWSLLQSLVDELSWSAGGGRARVRLLKRRRGGGGSVRSSGGRGGVGGGGSWLFEG